ncbi:MAG: VCBS repeat-containing protein [Planctomycetes bacterium]|nr:VCBS repeat-containing protein [Planctomycetota bacterium]
MLRRTMWTVRIALLAVLTVACWSSTATAQFAKFVDETSQRSVVASSLFATDSEEKDYAWGDLDHDGDIDLVVVRKQPFTTTGRRRNVLFMNEGTAQGHPVNGVLVDGTNQYIPAFLDLTNDRDVALADVDGDGWLDIVTAPTYSAGQPTTISHPRVYMNQGEVAGVWQGFVYEPARIPLLPVTPNFCAVAAGDVTGNGRPDLYFVDYGNLEDRLLINDGNGFFTDESLLRMTSTMLHSDFGTSGVIVDMNGDGTNDVVKDMALAILTRISYNNPPPTKASSTRPRSSTRAPGISCLPLI